MTKRCLLILAVLLLAATWAVAQVAQTYESVTFGAAATGFTASTLTLPNGQNVTECSGRLETAQIRVRFDGIAPTAAEGQIVEIGDWLTITGPANLQQFKGIRTGGVNGVIKFQCYGSR